MPRISCIMTECRNAVPSHAMSDPFSTVPSPIAAPAEHRIGPVGAEKDSRRSESPGHHGPAPGDVDPLLAGIFQVNGPARRQRDGKADLAQWSIGGWMSIS